MKSIANNELNTAFFYLSSITGMGLTIEELKKVRAARKNVKEKLDEYNDLRKEIWGTYGINDDVQLNGHPEKEQAMKKVIDFDSQPVTVDGLNFLSEDKAIALCPATWNQNDIDKVIEYLAS